MKKFNFDFQEIVDSASDIVVVTKADPIDLPGPEIVYVNDAFVKLTGFSKEEVIGESPRILQGEKTDLETRQEIKVALEKKEPIRKHIMNFGKDGTMYWLDMSIKPLHNEIGEVTHFVAIERDITSIMEKQSSLEELVRRDPLTGLLNRRGYQEVCNKEFARTQRSGLCFSLLMIDIDHFKNVNDTYGHSVGDIVLEKVSSICCSTIRLQDSVARIGGEEFCIVLPETDSQNASLLAERLRKNIEEEETISGRTPIKITISIGISQFNRADKTPENILERADSALYKAKDSGRNQVIIKN